MNVGSCSGQHVAAAVRMRRKSLQTPPRERGLNRLALKVTTIMRIALAALLGLHGLIHLLGPAKAFGWADVSQLRTTISPATGLLWLAAAVVLIAASAGLALRAP